MLIEHISLGVVIILPDILGLFERHHTRDSAGVGEVLVITLPGALNEDHGPGFFTVRRPGNLTTGGNLLELLVGHHIGNLTVTEVAGGTAARELGILETGGVGVGLLAAGVLSSLLASLLYGVDPLDPLTFTAVSSTLLAVALVVITTVMTILVAAALPTTDTVHKVSIIPRGIGALGYTLHLATEDRFLMTRCELEDKLAMAHGLEVRVPLLDREYLHLVE